MKIFVAGLAMSLLVGVAFAFLGNREDSWTERLANTPLKIPEGAQNLYKREQSSPFGSSYEYVFKFREGSVDSCADIGIPLKTMSPGHRTWYTDATFEVFGVHIDAHPMCEAQFKGELEEVRIHADRQYMQVFVTTP